MASVHPSIGELEAGLDALLGGAIAAGGRSSLETRLLVVEHVLEVAVPDPVEAHAPGAGLAHGTGRVGEPAAEGRLVDSEAVHARHDLEGAPLTRGRHE